MLIGNVNWKRKAIQRGRAVSGCAWKRGTSKSNGDYSSNVTNFIKGSPTWGADTVIAGQEIIGSLWNLTVYIGANKIS